MGFHINHGGAKRTSTGARVRRLLKYRRLQKTRFVKWKERAAYIWLNNAPALQRFLQDMTFFTTKKARKASRT